MIRIQRAFGPLRAATAEYLEQNHYMRSSGGSGQMFAVLDEAGEIAGACLIGATTSQNQDRSLIRGACLSAA